MSYERSRPFWSQAAIPLTTAPIARALPEGVRELVLFATTVDAYVKLGGTYTPTAVASVNGVQTISSLGTPTGGTFTLAGAGETTSALTFDESAADVDTALANLAAFDAADVATAGGPLPTAITLTWSGVWAAALPRLTVNSAVTGGTNSRIVIATTTAPAGSGGYGILKAGREYTLRPNLDQTGAGPDRFLHMASVTATGTLDVSAYR